MILFLSYVLSGHTGQSRSQKCAHFYYEVGGHIYKFEVKDYVLAFVCTFTFCSQFRLNRI